MKFDLISDFHVEMNPPDKNCFYNWGANQGADTLVIAGDVANSLAMAQLVVTEAARVYKSVVYVDGNHEHYGHILFASNPRGYFNEGPRDWKPLTIEV